MRTAKIMLSIVVLCGLAAYGVRLARGPAAPPAAPVAAPAPPGPELRMLQDQISGLRGAVAALRSDPAPAAAPATAAAAPPRPAEERPLSEAEQRAAATMARDQAVARLTRDPNP